MSIKKISALKRFVTRRDLREDTQSKHSATVIETQDELEYWEGP